MYRQNILTHKQCANYRDGFCTFYGIPVNPDEPACPNFTPKTITQTPQSSPTPMQPPPPPQTANFPPAEPGWGRGGYGMYARGRGQGRGGGRGFGAGQGRGRMGGFAAGPTGYCVCPNCGYTVPHVAGNPCFRQVCPRCGSRMTRKR